ncbi:hypothetical protein KCMC57_up16080 [Kitasatospora sp. CMC57]|uniref:Uncharacterized protein n=1 Tax=Kitasatospora sp. CMC57 TaxID=3231513 RepID=A0AB33K132_9ACTN
MNATPEYDGPRTAGRHYSARYHLLDRQVVHPDGTSVCKVDDLEFTPAADGHLYATAVLVGPQALGPRLRGRLGQWCTTVAARLALSPEPGPGRLSIERITHIGSALVCTPGPDRVHALEDWIREHFVRRIPGADHANR